MAVNLQELALAQALYKRIGEYVSTKGSSLRTEADAALMDMYEKDGIDRQRIRINDVEVGTLGISFSKEHTEREMVVDSVDDLIDFAMADHDVLRTFLAYQADHLADWYMDEGVVPDGCHLHMVGVPKRPKGTTLRVDSEKVAQALGSELPSYVAGLLEA